MRGCSLHLSTANGTLNFLVGLDGVKYANKIEVASNSYEFLSFFFDTQHPVLEVYDIIVVDDLAAHHGEAERAPRDFFNDIRIEHLFLQVHTMSSVAKQ